MALNPTHSRSTRNIEQRWHYVREQIEKRAISLSKVKGDGNPAYVFTKALENKRLKRLLHFLGLGNADIRRADFEKDVLEYETGT